MMYPNDCIIVESERTISGVVALIVQRSKQAGNAIEIPMLERESHRIRISPSWIVIIKNENPVKIDTPASNILWSENLEIQCGKKRPTADPSKPEKAIAAPAAPSEKSLVVRIVGSHDELP